MIEVRFFATLREGRGKIAQVPAEEVFTAASTAFTPNRRIP